MSYVFSCSFLCTIYSLWLKCSFSSCTLFRVLIFVSVVIILKLKINIYLFIQKDCTSIQKKKKKNSVSSQMGLYIETTGQGFFAKTPKLMQKISDVFSEYFSSVFTDNSLDVMYMLMILCMGFHG